jgi:NAD(P)-dependent dehydrogenase (short-subunit alcohol dehydrogenase family)
MGVDGLRFVITGGAVGIGAGTARLAASRGARVVVSDMNDEPGQALVEEINAAGGDAVYHHCDVTDERQVEGLMAAASEAFGGIDILHNNAGIHESMISKNLSLADMSRDCFEKVMGVNVTGVWLCAKYALPYLRESEHSSIIHQLSVWLPPMPGLWCKQGSGNAADQDVGGGSCSGWYSR